MFKWRRRFSRDQAAVNIIVGKLTILQERVMATNTTSNQYGTSRFNSINIDFYTQLKALTKNLSPSQLEILRDYVSKIQLTDKPTLTPAEKKTLSSRETEVLILVTNGYSRRDISAALGISVNTAARHIANIYQKLGISCVAEATHYALVNNIVGKNRMSGQRFE